MKNVLKELYEDAKNIQDKDPACRNIFEAIILAYSVELIETLPPPS